MGTGDYFCVTLRGGAPWGFSLREGEGDTYRSLQVFQVEAGGRALLAGVHDGDEVVSVNGEPCADLNLTQALGLIQNSSDCLQLLVKRHTSGHFESKAAYCRESSPAGEVLATTTLLIPASSQKSQRFRDFYISESQDKAYYSEPDAPGVSCARLQATLSSGNLITPRGPHRERDEDARQSLSPGAVVELQVSLSEQTLDDTGTTALGSARGIEGFLPPDDEATETLHTATHSLFIPCPVRQPLSQHGVVLSSPSMLGQVEVTLQHPSSTGRGVMTLGEGVVVTASQGEKEEGGGSSGEGPPASFSVSFQTPTGEAASVEEWDSDSEGSQAKPNKHHARHSRLRRSESLSDKQVKEAKSKCKRIALLLTAAPPNPNNKGVLMFKKHRQRAKKYTLVSYGTGENEPGYEDEEDDDKEDNSQGTHTIEFTLVAPSDSELDEHFLTNVNGAKGVLTISRDKGLLEIERSLSNQAGMECLPETKGKGAVMFAQRRQRVDEIAAEHEELRRQGIPVEGIPEEEKNTAYQQVEEHSYMQATTEGHAYMDVSTQQQSQQQQNYQQYQEQQYYEQQQHQYQQQYQAQYEQQHYQQQPVYQQQQEYHQQQQQPLQQYSTNLNGTVNTPTHDAQGSFGNRTAKPFSVQNMVPSPYSPVAGGTSQHAMGQGEQIASRDERISTPAIKTGVLEETKRRNSRKPMFTFKETPKISPNPILLNLLNRNEKKLGFESGPEEDYLSLGAEACNFLQAPTAKHKTPPPVAPKPVVTPSSTLWSQQAEVTNQEIPQQAENSAVTPAVIPTTEPNLTPELEPTAAPAAEPSPPPAPQEAPANTAPAEQLTWSAPQPQSEQQQAHPGKSWEENNNANPPLQPEPDPVSSWASAQPQTQEQPPVTSWATAHVPIQEPVSNQSPAPSPWVTPQPNQPPAQAQPPTNAWASPSPQPQGLQSWGQPQEQVHSQTHAQPTWAQPQEQLQAQQQVQQPWAQSQEPVQQQQPSWVRQPQTDSPSQVPWVQQPQKKSQPVPPWVQPAQPESQPQSQWAQQPQHHAQQQAWPQVQAQAQSQPPWVSSPQPPQQQPSVSTWPPQAQVQPPWAQSTQDQLPSQSQVPLNPWAPVPTQLQPTWSQQPPENTQPPMNSWGPMQNQAHPQPSWVQPVPAQSPPQPSWHQSPPLQQPASLQPPVNAWSPGQTQPQTPVHAWAPQSQQAPLNTSPPMVNTRVAQLSPKPWQAPQNAPRNCTPPPPPQRVNSFTVGQRSSSPVNPMATILNPSGNSSAFAMPTVKGKGADLFAKRQSRMEKFIVDSETVQANKESRSSSPAASLPTEWKYSPNALGRSYSLSPPARVQSLSQQSTSVSSSSYSLKPPARASTAPPERRTSWLGKAYKPPTPWEAASRHPLGLVDEAFAFQDLQQTIATNVHQAAQRKLLPEPPPEWKARVSNQPHQKTGSQTWSQGCGSTRPPLPWFSSPAKSMAPASAYPTGYRSLPRQWQPESSMTDANLRPNEYNRSLAKPTFKAVHTSSTTWTWKR